LRAAQRSATDCVKSVKLRVSAIAYLRAAQAYILISMPTGTSTIFGAFQAILALLQKRDKLRPLRKVARNENFASEIFAIGGHVATQPQRSDRHPFRQIGIQISIKDIAVLCNGPMLIPALESGVIRINNL
jgi:hypothetical protein